MESVIHNLQTFNHKYFTHYPTVMFSTGPMFISTIYGFWMGNHPDVHHDRDAVRVIPKSLYGKNAKEGTVPDSFFDHYYGSSWHADDAGFITFLGRWGRGLLLIGGFVLFIGVLRLVFYRRRGSSGLRYSNHQFPPPAYLFPDSHFLDWRGQQIPLLPFTNQTPSRPSSPSRSSTTNNLANSIPAILYYPFNPSTWASPTLPQTPLSNQNTLGRAQNGTLAHLLSYVLPKSWIAADDYEEVEQDECEEEEEQDTPPTPFSHHRSTTWARMEFQRARERELQRIKENHSNSSGQPQHSNTHSQHHHSIDSSSNSNSNSNAHNAHHTLNSSHHSHNSHQEEIEALLASLEPQLSQQNGST